MIATWFPDWTVNKLTKTAIAHAADLALAFDHEPSQAPDARLVVNMLRHEYTDYHDDQSGDRHGEACDAIATTYPWMVGECAGQKARRMASDAEWDLQVAAETLTVGQQVSLAVKGHARTGIVTAVARSMVTIDYRIKTGAARQVKVYAGLVAVAVAA